MVRRGRKQRGGEFTGGQEHGVPAAAAAAAAPASMTGGRKRSGRRRSHRRSRRGNKRGGDGGVISTAAVPFGLLALQRFFKGSKTSKRGLQKMGKSFKRTFRRRR
jgi:hypothetical protein